MAQKQQGKYSEYINSFLNSSPSKTAYSFSKTERFKTENYPYYQKNTETLNRSFIAKAKTIKTNVTSTRQPFKRQLTRKQDKLNKEEYIQYQKISKKQDFQVFSVRRNLQRILKEMERDRMIFTEVSQEQKKLKIEYVYLNRDTRQAKNKITTKNSQQSKTNVPMQTIVQRKSQYLPNQTSNNNIIHNLQRTHNISRTQIISRTQNQKRYPTVSGYYPVGLQMNSKGVYSYSKFKNVNSNSFGSPPPKSKSPNKNEKEKAETTRLFSSFSQFGTSRY